MQKCCKGNVVAFVMQIPDLGDLAHLISGSARLPFMLPCYTLKDKVQPGITVWTLLFVDRCGSLARRRAISWTLPAVKLVLSRLPWLLSTSAKPQLFLLSGCSNEQAWTQNMKLTLKAKTTPTNETTFMLIVWVINNCCVNTFWELEFVQLMSRHH